MNTAELINEVAQAIRLHDGDHTKGAGELAEISLRATADYFRRQADASTTNTMRSIFLVAGDLTDPNIA